MARALKKERVHSKRLILEALIASPSDVKGVAERVGLAHASTAKHVTDLARLGLIQIRYRQPPRGQRPFGPGQGRMSAVWAATGQGRAVAGMSLPLVVPPNGLEERLGVLEERVAALERALWASRKAAA